MSERISVIFATGSPDGEALNASLVKTPQVIYEDDELVVVSKPRQMHSVSHKMDVVSGGDKRIIRESDGGRTLAEWMNGRFPECEYASPSPLEGGLVQRLDFFTSGLLVAAKTRTVWRELRESQSSGGFVKRYHALVEGSCDQWREGAHFTGSHLTVSQPLYYKKGGKRAYYSRKGNKFSKFPAESKVSMLRMLRDSEASCSLVEVESSNLHRHQVRAHLSWVGSPLVGDVLYNARFGLERCRNMLHDMLQDTMLNIGRDNIGRDNAGRDLDGFLLHASYLRFPHPRSRDTVECSFSFPYLRDDCLSVMSEC